MPKPPPVRPRSLQSPEVAQNERFVRQVLALIVANCEHRGQHGIYGEVAVKFRYLDGVITEAKLVEETILKPLD